MSYVVGLTGGIGSGKTVVSDHFSTLGVPIIDTDVIARKIVEPGEATLQQLCDTFGEVILNESGELNRKTLRSIAFAKDENKKLLDSITHPAIRAETVKQLSNVSYPYCVVVVPLLHKESPFLKFMHKILVVVTERTTRINRVMARSGISKEETIRIMDSQVSDQERIDLANDIIENNGSIEQAQLKTEYLHCQYLDLSQAV